MSQSSTLFIGMDVQKETIAMTYVAPQQGAAVTYFGTIGTRQSDIDTLIRTRPSQAQHFIFISEAGLCGYWLYCSLQKKDYDCRVVAPSLIPKKAGIGSKRTAVTPCNWPAREIFPQCMPPQWKIKLSVVSRVLQRLVERRCS